MGVNLKKQMSTTVVLLAIIAGKAEMFTDIYITCHFVAYGISYPHGKANLKVCKLNQRYTGTSTS